MHGCFICVWSDVPVLTCSIFRFLKSPLQALCVRPIVAADCIDVANQHTNFRLSDENPV